MREGSAAFIPCVTVPRASTHSLMSRGLDARVMAVRRGSRVGTSRRRLEKKEEEEEMLLAIWNGEDVTCSRMILFYYGSINDSRGKFFTVMAVEAPSFSRKRRPTLEINHPRD